MDGGSIMALEITPTRWSAAQTYLEDVFAAEPPALAQLREEAVAAGFPTISIGPAGGRLLALLAGLLRDGRGAERVIEIGMLGGYSAGFLAQGLAAHGRLITVEPEAERVAFARQRFAAMGETRIEVREGTGIEVLDSLATELAPESVDLVFLDAIKTEYLEYFRRSKPLLRPGGLLIADNVIGTGDYWISDPAGLSESRDAIDRFNRTVAADQDFSTMAVPIRQGLLIARRC